jgi:hypothetical protein
MNTVITLLLEHFREKLQSHRSISCSGFVSMDVWTASSLHRPRRPPTSSRHAAASFRSSARPASGQIGGWRPTAVRGFDD